MLINHLKNLTTFGLEKEKDLNYVVAMKEKLRKNNSFFKEYRLKLLPFFKYNELLFHTFDDNPFLKYCHRKMPINNYFSSFKSTFILNNETLNIFSHFFAFLIFAFFLLKSVFFTSPIITPDFLQMQSLPNLWKLIDFSKLKFDLEISLTCFCATWLFSTLYHIFKANSLEDYKRFLILDLCGIILSIAGSNHVIIDVLLHFVAPRTTRFFIALNWSMAVALLLAIPRIVEFRMTKIRTISFIIFMSFSTIVSMGLGLFFIFVQMQSDAVYSLHTDGNKEMFSTWLTLCKIVFLTCLAPNWVFEILGLIIKNEKYPEKFFHNQTKLNDEEEKKILFEKNYFSVCLTCHSHVIFHILSASGCFLFYNGFLNILNKKF